MKKAAMTPPAKDNGKNQQDHPNMADPIALANILMEVIERSQPLVKEFFEKYEFEVDENMIDPLHMREAYANFMRKLWENPQKLAEMQMQFWQNWAHLWQESTIRFMGGEGHDLYEPEKGDKRFKSPLWQESALFNFIKQSYLMTSRWMEDVVHSTEGLDEETMKKLDFAAKQFINAMAPTNFLLTNPEVLQETLDSKGENLVRGLENLIEDLERGKGQLRISTTNYDAFRVGENLATTPGKVVFQNDLMQLIQYETQTEKVFKRPLLIVPPWINKFYILDLQPQNSFIKWLVEQGHSVFTISWVNPSRELAQKRFEDYMSEGVLEAMDKVSEITGEPDCNIMGYCLGGTLLSVTLAYLAAHGNAERIASATFLTTLIDFEKSGDMKLFMDDAQIEMMEKTMAEQGFLDADHLRKTFSMLRSNDLVWSFVVNNYLMGREPFPFDLLYWNDDATNMPAAMHRFYLRKCYRDNMLVKPGAVTMNGTPIDMGKVNTPCYFLSTKEDHIAPWQATYAATQLLGGENTFTLAASGHVAGVVNPPAKNKYCYWTAKENPADAASWFDSSESHDGSWWPHWQEWCKQHGNGQIGARKIGQSIEDAPGAYVRMKAD